VGDVKRVRKNISTTLKAHSSFRKSEKYLKKIGSLRKSVKKS
jgi:hypothetical protein